MKNQMEFLASALVLFSLLFSAGLIYKPPINSGAYFAFMSEPAPVPRDIFRDFPKLPITQGIRTPKSRSEKQSDNRYPGN